MSGLFAPIMTRALNLFAQQTRGNIAKAKSSVQCNKKKPPEGGEVTLWLKQEKFVRASAAKHGAISLKRGKSTASAKLSKRAASRPRRLLTVKEIL